MQCANLADFAEVKHLQKKKVLYFRVLRMPHTQGLLGMGYVRETICSVWRAVSVFHLF